MIKQEMDEVLGATCESAKDCCLGPRCCLPENALQAIRIRSKCVFTASRHRRSLSHMRRKWYTRGRCDFHRLEAGLPRHFCRPEHAPGEAEALAPGVQEDLLEGLVLPVRLPLVALSGFVSDSEKSDTAGFLGHTLSNDLGYLLAC